MCQYDIKPTRSLGQNFLADERVVLRLKEGVEITADDLVIEIGPGLGSLTRVLTDAETVIAVEIDKKMVKVLEDTLQDYTNIEIIQADALKIDLYEIASGYPSIKIAANLPYYITTQLIEKLIIELAGSSLMLLMMQKEAAERLFAQPGNKMYGPVSVLVSLYGNIRKYMRVSAAAYIPRPHVDSVVVRLTSDIEQNMAAESDSNPGIRELDINTRRNFHVFLNACFSQRRKVIANVLKESNYKVLIEKGVLVDVIEKYGLSQSARAQEIPPQAFLELFLDI